MPGGGRKAKDSSERRVEWDEDNLRTHEESVLRGEYGTMKIDEPKTPFAAPGSPVVGTPEEEGLEKLYLSIGILEQQRARVPLTGQRTQRS